MKKIIILLAVFVAGFAFSDVFERLSPPPRLTVRLGVRGEVELAEPEPSASNTWYRLTVRNGRPLYDGSPLGKRYAKATFYQLQSLCATSRVPDCVVTDWPDTALRGLEVDASSPGGDAIALRTILVESARHKLNLVVWKLPVGTNDVFEGVSDNEYKRMAYFSWKQGIYLVPSVNLEKAPDGGVQWLEKLLALTPPSGLQYVDLRGEVSEGARRLLAEKGRTLLAEVPDARRMPAPVVAPGKVDALPPDLVRWLWRGECEKK